MGLVGPSEVCSSVLFLLSDGEVSVSDVGGLRMACQGWYERREEGERGHEHCSRRVDEWGVKQ